MSRKFLYTLHALVSNYGTNKITHLQRSTGGVWTIIGNITGPSTNNLNSLASNLQGSRVIFANYPSNGIVPFNYSGGTWIPGVLVPSSQSGNTAAVTMSDDGLHALSGGDFQNTFTPYEFNTSTGLWLNGTAVPLPSTHPDSLQMTRDGNRALVTFKYDNVAYPLTRNPGTGIWSVSGSAITLNASNERFFAIGISVDGSRAIIGSNKAGVLSDGLIWNGSTWDRISCPVTLFSASWRPDGLSAIGGNAEDESGAIRTVNYNPSTGAFTAGQTFTGYGRITGVVIANDGVGDIALAADFNSNAVIPVNYSRTTGLWTPETPISSALFSNPLNLSLFPVW